MTVGESRRDFLMREFAEFFFEFFGGVRSLDGTGGLREFSEKVTMQVGAQKFLISSKKFELFISVRKFIVRICRDFF